MGKTIALLLMIFSGDHQLMQVAKTIFVVNANKECFDLGGIFCI